MNLFYLFSIGIPSILILETHAHLVTSTAQVNPATSFADSPWPLLGPALTNLPSQLYNALPIALSPILTNPLAIAMNNVTPGAPLQQQVKRC